MRATEIVSIIEEFAPSGIQESWDNSGLSVGDLDRNVDLVLLALDCTPDIIEEALSTGAQMIITHHPLIFKSIKQISNSTDIGRMINKIIKNNLIVYSAHTNIDKVISGVSGIMALKLGLVNLELLRQECNGEYGLGVIGDLETPVDFSQILRMVKERFDPQVIKCSKPTESLIKRIALCGGNGASLIDKAKESRAQLFITGDVSYHNFFCENDFMIMDIGHYESEIGLLDLLKSILTKKLPTFAVRIAEKNINPIHYYY
ncbi:MAG: Nif3-like dinuclear metal center hexameric protein [Rikenellaceae bacterium]